MALSHDYLVWEKWREKGGKPPRPAALLAYLKKYHRVPQKWWDTYEARHPKPVPTPPPAPATPHKLRVMFTAEAPMLAYRTPRGGDWIIALSADPAFRSNVLGAIGPLKDQGHRLMSWSDCHYTPYTEAQWLNSAYLLTGAIGQAENSNEYDEAVARNAPVIVGNSSSLTPDRLNDAITRVNAGQLTWLQEDYWGDGHPPPSVASADGIPATGLAIGCYSHVRPLTLMDYVKDLPSVAATCSIYLAEGMLDAEWDYLSTL